MRAFRIDNRVVLTGCDLGYVLAAGLFINTHYQSGFYF